MKEDYKTADFSQGTLGNFWKQPETKKRLYCFRRRAIQYVED